VPAERRDRALRRVVQLVSQNPYASLDPRRTVGQSVGEPLRNWRPADGGVRDRRELARRVATALDRVALPADVVDRLPAELSGGQRQRVTIARSLVNDPAIIWADEPTGALDSKTAQDIMDLLIELNRTKGLTVVIVTHDPGVGAQAHRIVHMRDGEIEHATRTPAATGIAAD
jgi:peptide/nickel transport system ATP-binding protein